ncbi:MAG: response regulator [Clostridia bacterium]|nr:response regulator [Clostridia bacterium]
MSKRILIADDAAMMRNMLKDMLTKGGYDVIGEAADGVEAVEKYKQLKPDLTILDITMPNLDGIGALKEIIGFDQNAKCIMVSGMGSQATVIESIQSGAKDFILKPFSKSRVLEAVSRLLGK